MNSNLFDKIETERLISEKDTVLIAFSGGADSVFLAEFLLHMRDKYSLTLKAAHVEHGIRGEESLVDCRFAENYCRKNGIECFTLHINALQEAKAAGQSVEEYSRNRRYDFFASIECDKIATAHHLSDNIETMLFRLIRGTSIHGLCAIPQKRGKIIRPLLHISGKEIRTFLDENKISYCTDSTNHCSDYSRNYIRNDILPLFSALNTAYEGALNRFIESVKQDSDFISQQADNAFASVYTDNCIDTAALKAYHISVIKRVLLKYLDLYNLKADEFHLNEMIRLLYTSSRVQLSGSMFAVSAKGLLRIADLAEKDKSAGFAVTKEKYSFKDFLNKCELCGKKFDFCCDYDKIVGSISVRSRRSGDTISPAGRSCTKSLKKLFNELSVPVENRKSIPVIADDSGVIGIYGYFADERVKISEKTEYVMVVNVSMEDKI